MGLEKRLGDEHELREENGRELDLTEEEEHGLGFGVDVEHELGEDDFWMGIKMRRRKNLEVSCKRAVPSPDTSTSTCR